MSRSEEQNRGDKYSWVRSKRTPVEWTPVKQELTTCESVFQTINVRQSGWCEDSQIRNRCLFAVSRDLKVKRVEANKDIKVVRFEYYETPKT